MESTEKIRENLLSLCDMYSQSYLQSNVNKSKIDSSFLNNILADDWNLITADCGDEVNKEKQLKDLYSGKLKVHSIKDLNVRCKIYGNSAIISGKRISKVEYNNRDVSDTTRFTQVYTEINGNWKCVSTQVTSIIPNIERHIISISNNYREAYINSDVEYLENILSDDWNLITADCGDEVNKEKQLKDLKSGTLKVSSIEDSDITCRVYSDSAIVSGRRKSNVHYKNRDVSDETRFTQFYVLKNDSWKCVSTQITSFNIDPERHC